MDYYCEVCDKTIKLKNKTKYLNTKSHTDLFMAVINRYCAKNQELFEEEEILKKHVNIYFKKFEMYNTYKNWKLQFVDSIIHVKSRDLCSGQDCSKKIGYLKRKNECFRRFGLELSHIYEMKISFKTHLRYLTYTHYLYQPTCMIEWILNKVFYKNPKPIKTPKNLPFQLIEKYEHNNHP